MSTSTYIKLLNANDDGFLKAKNGTPEELEEWESWNGPLEDRPGAEMEGYEDIAQETSDEYGGFVIAVKDLPKECTHILIFRC